MLNLTLDHNCIINLETGEGQSAALSELIALHRAGVVRVHVGVVSAAENVRGGGEPSLDAFVQRVERLGLDQLPRVLPEWRLGMTGLDGQLLAADDDLAARVQAIVHPAIPANYDQFTAEKGRDPSGPIHRTWRNRICDIDAMLAHIRHGQDIFVTEDRHFLDHRGALSALGAGRVLTPEETLRHVGITP